jgi:hypothetical protein
VYVIQDRADPLASFGASQHLVDGLRRGQAHMDALAGRNHILEESSGQRDRVVAAVDWVTAK